MTRWFRMYDDAINDPKILKLSDKLHRFWIGILCVASKHGGKLPSREDIALLMRMKLEKSNDAIESLIKSGLIDNDGVILSPHNWNGRQYKSDVSTERVKRFRKRVETVSETPPETEQRQKEKTQPSAAPVDQEADLFRRGREVFGASAGGLVKNLLKAKNGNVPKARAAVEEASTKHDAREYIGGVIRKGNEGDDFHNPMAGRMF